jgi:putative heme-binding domain-containing protein
LRDPSRDRTHGRVYRVTYEGRPLSQSPKVAGEPIEKLLDVLRHPELRVRYRARVELSGRPSADVLAAVDSWVKTLDPKDPEHERLVLEALWLNQSHNRVNLPLLERVLASPDFRARAAATRVLCYQRDRVSGALELVKNAAADEHPRVRLEAVRAASFFTAPEAVEVPLVAAERPDDEYLKFVRAETLKTLEPYWKKALAEGREIGFTTDAGRRYLLANISNEQLLKMERSAAVCREMLRRPGLLDDDRTAAIRTLAKLEGKQELTVAIGAIHELDSAATSPDASLVFDLVRQVSGRSAEELAAARAELAKLATSARQPVLRQIGFASLVNVDRSADKAWDVANHSARALKDFVDAVPLLADASLRASVYERLVPLVDGLPKALASEAAATAPGRFVRIELPGGKGTLTLAEVEVTSGGRNVARQGKAKQVNTAHGGDASRAIDGNKSGVYGDGGQTHTEEQTPNPWWEVDLGSEMPIEAITVFNRTDGYLGRRLNGFAVRVLDANRNVVFSRSDVEAPRESAAIEVGQGDSATAVRQAAMLALASVRGQEAKTFGLLAPLVSRDRDRAAAIRALKRIDRADWPKEQAAPLLAAVASHIRSLPVDARTSPEALDAMEFAHALAGLLPADDARRARAELGELGVRVIRVGTLFERMSFDQDVIAVRAGKPVEFVFENTDLMPHNFVIVRPGTLEEIGTTAEATAQQPDAAGRHYVPQSTAVLLASKLIQPRESQKISFVAPNEPGVYPYVCTYPGHWRRMYGALYVVEDLDAYLENPESYLASHPLEVKDALLKDRRPRVEWKFDDLAAAVGGMKNGRSYGNGKQLFQVASCVACHKLDGAGNAIGPDLVKLDEKFQSLDVLKELLDPSARINEKFQSYVFQLDSGKVVTGLILEETPERIKVIENPLAKAEPIEIKPAEVDERAKSTSSIMPKGLLDKLSREEILDLIAYVLARGNQQDPLFSGGHEHAGHH